MKIGYARISTSRQSLEMQISALEKEGCDKIFSEVVSGSKVKRDQLDEMLNYARSGDTIVIWKLDRLGRSLKHLIELIQDFEKKEIHFYSISDKIDTSTPMGKLVFHFMGALAQFERELIRERTKAGLENARARGRKGGRKKGISKKLKDKAKIIFELYHNKTPVREIAVNQSVSVASVYKCRDYWEAKLRGENPDKTEKTE